MSKLYTFNYFNKYYNQPLTCEFPGETEAEARNTACERINWVDKKYLKTQYVPEDFELAYSDDTLIEENKQYKTRSGLRVEITSVNPNSTTSGNVVSGHIFHLDRNGKEKKSGSWNLWSAHGRIKAVGRDELDLVEA